LADQLTVLSRDEHVVIDKPPGLLVHRSEIDRHETHFDIQILRDQIGRRVWAAHRLDHGTSGVLLFALNRELPGTLGRQFAAGKVEKRYWAVVRSLPPDAGTIDHRLRREHDPYVFAGVRSSTGAQAAVTNYRKLAEIELPVAVDRYPFSRYACSNLTR
jgi:tRNA pseudouridine65 synthase